MLRGLLRLGHNWVSQVCDPLAAARGIRGFAWYLSDYRSYRKLPGAEPAGLADLHPILHNRHAAHELDAHYFYVNAWAMRQVIAAGPAHHVDVASQTILAALLSAVLPTTYIDYRPLQAELAGLTCRGGTLTELPFGDSALASLSCLHVAEHVGLGRYGDPLDPLGTRKAAEELQRVLAPGGQLYFAVPVGRQRLCFNAHRVHAAETICDYFSGLELLRFSGVHDDGRFVEGVELGEFRDSSYACGMFHFTRKEQLPGAGAEGCAVSAARAGAGQAVQALAAISGNPEAP